MTSTNWPSIDIQTRAINAAGTIDLADALNETYLGRATTTTASTAASLGAGRYGSVPAGTPVTITSVSNAGFNGIQVCLRTADGHIIVTYWSNIDEAALRG